MSDLSEYPDQWECLCMIDSRGDPLPEIEVVPQERVATLTVALEEAKRGLERIGDKPQWDAGQIARSTLTRTNAIERGEANKGKDR